MIPLHTWLAQDSDSKCYAYKERPTNYDNEGYIPNNDDPPTYMGKNILGEGVSVEPMEVVIISVDEYKKLLKMKKELLKMKK
jgi:hypothetical protein